MESKEEKLEKLRKERELEILKKNYNKFYLSEIGGLSRYGWGENILFIGMPVKVKKPDNTWRNGVVQYFNVENENFPKVGVVCGKNKIKFEKRFSEVVPDRTLTEICEWENIEVPEKLKKMPTKQLLTEFRRMRRFYHSDYDDNNINLEKAFKKELFLREHVGPTSAKTRKEDRRKKAKEHHGKSK